MSDFDFDFFVIGAGSGGVRASRLAASFGQRVAVVEQQYLGGTCVNVGCVPKKLFYYGAQLHEEFSLAESFGWQLSTPGFQWEALRDNKNKEISRLNDIYRELLINAGVTLIEGSASFVDAHTVEVSGKRYRAKNILIASGSTAYVPDIPGKKCAITSADVFYLEALPKKIIIVGGGYIAVEFAGIFNGLGVETELDYRGSLFLRGFDDEVRDVVADEMVKKGITIRFNSTIVGLEKLENNQIKVRYQDGSLRVVDQVLYATGRTPYTDHLKLDSAGVELTESGAVKVNADFQTSTPSIFAIGDVIDRMQLTPVALAEATVLVNNLFQGAQQVMDYEMIPTAVFSSPNVATVGLSEQQARARYGQIDVYRSRFTSMKSSMSASKQKSFMKMIVDIKTDKVVGLHMVGNDAGEIIQGMAVAMKAGATKAIFDSTIGIHPTAAEEFVTMRSK